MMESEIQKGSLFVSHFEAIKQIPDVKEQVAMYEAIFNYQFYGTAPENLPPIANLLMTAIFPVIEKEAASKNGGRLEKVSAEAVSEKVKELGSKKAAAEYFGVTERTIYNKLAGIEKTNPEISHETSCKFHEIEKNERRMKKDECKNEEEREAAQTPLAPPKSFNSVEFPVERAKYLPPPTLDEVKAHCKEQGYSFNPKTFLAYYNATGWKKKNGCKITDWRNEAVVWEQRERKDDKTRASPVYKTWVAPSKPELAEKERIEISEVLNGMVSKIKAKVALEG